MKTYDAIQLLQAYLDEFPKDSEASELMYDLEISSLGEITGSQNDRLKVFVKE